MLGAISHGPWNFTQPNSPKRFLIFFSYLGTNYSGVQRQVPRRTGSVDIGTVQGVLEFGLHKVLRGNFVLYGSSRTDQGVHGIESCAQFDLKIGSVTGSRGSEPFCNSPELLCKKLNVFLEENKTDIRVRRVIQVSNDFNCRKNALSRTYCYRIAVQEPSQDLVGLECTDSFIWPVETSPKRFSAPPIQELYRCQVVPGPLDIQSVQKAIRLFIGTKNFKTFSTPSKRLDSEESDFIKTIKRVSITQVNADRPWNYLDNNSKGFQLYDFHFEGSGFLYKQVRKMVGTLIGIASGVISSKDIHHMLQNPDYKNWRTKCTPATSHGLFLKSVNYSDLPIIRGCF